ncbi:MAG: hypothetical protein IJU03_01025 [Thermoguttaceae bacterium]|nr:hypothetical protein [Thermoguttaceae bacterium]
MKTPDAYRLLFDLEELYADADSVAEELQEEGDTPEEEAFLATTDDLVDSLDDVIRILDNLIPRIKDFYKLENEDEWR